MLPGEDVWGAFSTYFYVFSVLEKQILLLFTVIPAPGLYLYAIYGDPGPLGPICMLFTVIPARWAQSARYLRPPDL